MLKLFFINDIFFNVLAQQKGRFDHTYLYFRDLIDLIVFFFIISKDGFLYVYLLCLYATNIYNIIR